MCLEVFFKNNFGEQFIKIVFYPSFYVFKNVLKLFILFLIILPILHNYFVKQLLKNKYKQ